MQACDAVCILVMTLAVDRQFREGENYRTFYTVLCNDFIIFVAETLTLLEETEMKLGTQVNCLLNEAGDASTDIVSLDIFLANIATIV